MSDQFYTPQNEINAPLPPAKPQMKLIPSLFNIFVSPKEVFEQLPGNGASFWLPSLLIAASIIFFMLFYINHVLPSDIIDFMFQSNPEMAMHSTKEQLMQVYGFIKFSMVIVPVIFLIFPFFVSVFIYSVASKLLTRQNHSFLTWMGFCAWVYLPTIFVALVQVLSFIHLGGLEQFVALTDLTVLSLNELFKYEVGDPLYIVMSSINPFYVWTMVLSLYGFKQLTQSAWPISVLVNVFVSCASLGLLSIIGS